jgi:hypothetical protein
MVAATWVLHVWFAGDRDRQRLIPGWLPWHVAWTYFTGAAFIAAGLAVPTSSRAGPPRYRRFSWACSVSSCGYLGCWRVAVNNFQWGEFVVTCALTAGAWVVADSHRGTLWLAAGRGS